MTSRRAFLSRALAGTAVTGFSASRFDLPRASAAGAAETPPPRFIFIHKGNGLLPESLVPPSFDEQQREADRRGEAMVADLDGHDLPEWMAPLSKHREHLALLQGLSGKMCTTGHHTWCSSLGAFKANERISSIQWATVDFELARLFPSPVGHVELACFPDSGGNSRGNVNGIEKGFSARGPQQPNYAYGSPKVAMEELFQSVSSDQAARARYELEKRLLKFMAGQESGVAQELEGIERVKVANYADAIEATRRRNGRVEAMSDVIRQHIPVLDKKYFAEDLSTVDRQFGLSEVLLSTLISGMTNVATFTVDELGTRYTGLDGLEGETINLHDVGHNKSIGGVEAIEIRDRVRRQHMTLVDHIVTRLKNTPERNGSMFDNTMLFYFSDNGETHHSKGTEWPFVVLAGENAKLRLGRRYIRLPRYGEPGHQTLGNWYTTLLNAHGNPIDHYGALDVALTHDQRGPIEDFLA